MPPIGSKRLASADNTAANDSGQKKQKGSQKSDTSQRNKITNYVDKALESIEHLEKEQLAEDQDSDIDEPEEKNAKKNPKKKTQKRLVGNDKKSPKKDSKDPKPDGGQGGSSLV